VDDESHIVELLGMNLRQNGYETCSAADGRDVQACVLSEKPDLILLDLMLPGLGGLEVCRLLKQDPATAAIPVIMLTAKSEESDKVIGLGIGADDYITKPFGLRELLARVEARLRRAPAKGGGLYAEVYRAGKLEIDVQGHAVFHDGVSLALSPTEFTLLTILARHTGRTVRREELASTAGLSDGPDSGRSLDVHLRNLRKKIDAVAGGNDRIETVRGVGYRLHA